MDIRKTLDGFLRAAGFKLNQKLSLDRNGLCVFRDEKLKREYAIELPKDSSVLYFYSAICRVPYECSSEFFEKVLELNLCGLEYNQATFGLDFKTQNIVISYTRPMTGLDEITFFNILRNFIAIANRAANDLDRIVKELMKKYCLTEGDITDELGSLHSKITIEKLKA